MATIKEIAKRCNVSVATVSNVINGIPKVSEETQKRIQAVINELNYTPNSVAKNLKLKTTKMIGIIVEDITIFCAPSIIDGITAECEEKGYQILLMNLRLYKKFSDRYYESDNYFECVNKEIKELISKQVEGIIYVTAHEREIKYFKKKLAVPVAVAYGYSDTREIPSVVVDDFQGGYEMTKYLLEMGHRRIGVIAGKENSIHTKDRWQGYCYALQEAGIPLDTSLRVYGDWTRQCAYPFVDKFLEQEVTAVFCMNDLMAGGVYERLEELELIPGEDLSIAGYDDREAASYYNPPLTTVSLPLYEIGRSACDQVIRKIEQEMEAFAVQDSEIYSERGKLIIRGSVRTLEI